MGIRAHAPACRRWFTAAMLLALVAGCGGSGGGEAVEPPPVDPPVVTPLPAFDYGVFPSAAVVIGQQAFDTQAPGDTLETLSFPFASAVTNDGRLVVVDFRNEALKTYSDYDATPFGRAADFEIGQNAASIFAGSRIAIGIGPRVRIYDDWPAAGGSLQERASAGSDSGVNGCTADLLGDVRDAYITPAGKLIVADHVNHRVLIWSSIPELGPLGPANVVLGQPDMETCRHNGGLTEGSRADVLAFPTSVWSDDRRLVVADGGNNRVLVWDTFPDTTQAPAPASRVIGQVDLTGAAPNAGGTRSGATLSSPGSVDVNERGQLAVADRLNNRVLIWNSIPGRDGQPADQVIGQPDASSGGSATSDRQLFIPLHVRFHGRNLIVSEPQRNRVMIWKALN